MNNQIFYLLGAGASANAMPVAKNMRARLLLFAFWLWNENKNSNAKNNFEFSHMNLEKIISGLVVYESMDHYLRDLFNSNSNEYAKHKLYYVIYLLWETTAKPELYKDTIDILVKEKEEKFPFLNELIEEVEALKQGEMVVIDSRYKRFFTDLAVGYKDSLLGNISILTWNYDLQIDFATDKLESSGIISNILSDKINNGDLSTCKLLRLNGRVINNDIKSYSSDDAESKEKLFRDILENYSKNIPKVNRHLVEFVWESPGTTEDKRAKLSSFFKSKINPQNKDSKPDDNEQRTIQLIVIGYSFPFSNRQIDFGIIQGILENLTSKDEFEIVIQCPSEEDCNTSEERIKNFVSYFYNEREKNSNIKPTKDGYFANIKYRHVTSVREFYIPNTIGL